MAQVPPSTDADRAFDAMAAALSDKVCEHLTAVAAEYQAKLDSIKKAHDDEVAEYRFRLESRANKLRLVESKLKASETRVQRLRDALYANRHVIYLEEHIGRAKDALLEIERSRNAGSRPTMMTRQSEELHKLAEQLPNSLVNLEKSKQEAAELERAVWAD
jgi:DNA anti-recombination protein RmuC